MAVGKEPPIVRVAKTLAVFDHHIEDMDGTLKNIPGPMRNQWTRSNTARFGPKPVP
jgi:hypothetical protein